MCSRLSILRSGVPYCSTLRGSGFALVAMLMAGTVPLSANEQPISPPTPGKPKTASLSFSEKPATGAASPSSEMAYVILPDQLEGRAYYRLDDKATCKANDPQHTVIRSWADKLSFHGGNLLVWGAACNDSPTVIALKEATAELMVSRDLKNILYKGEKLTYFENPPKLCHQGIWCPVKPEN